MLLPTYLLQLFSLSVNWIDPCNIHFRLTAILTMLLTVAAKQAYIGGLLPRVGFLTPPEKTVNVTVFMFFVQVWLRVLASQQCYPNFNMALVKTWDYSKKSKESYFRGQAPQVGDILRPRVGRLDGPHATRMPLAHGELFAGPLAHPRQAHEGGRE